MSVPTRPATGQLTHQESVAKVRGRPFTPGHEKRGGRSPGVPNHVTREVADLARTLVENPVGLAKLQEQYEQGTLPPPVLCMLWHYAYGKPKERIEVNGQVDVLKFVVSNATEPATLAHHQGEDGPVN